MNPENYFNKQPEENKKEEFIKGDGFTIIRPEESSDIVRAREKKKKITEMETIRKSFTKSPQRLRKNIQNIILASKLTPKENGLNIRF